MNRTYLLLTGLLALLTPLLVSSCGSFRRHKEASSFPTVEPSELGSMHNVAVSGELWIGGVPSQEDLDLVQRRGIRHLIDLCTPLEEPDYDIDQVCDELELERLRVGIEDPDTISDEQVDSVLASLSQCDSALMFCGTGGRSAMFLAIHRVVNQAVPLDQALLDARRSGMKPGEPEEFVRRQTARLTS